ncbi:Putative LOC101846883, partial [Caligus rogercresseyi]
HPIVLGGPGLVVEIDESKFGRRKYNRGRLVEGHWVFGGVERESGKCFIVEVEDRRENTLLTILQQYVAPGTTIMSDGWASYRRIPDLGMTHLTVIHSRNFVDPLSGAHTQNIESLWSALKRFMRKMGVMNTSKEFFPSYLAEFTWRRKCSESNLSIFQNILKLIMEQYPV